MTQAVTDAGSHPLQISATRPAHCWAYQPPPHWHQEHDSSSTGHQNPRIPFIHSDDIASVTIEVMLSPQYTGQSLPITGPEALSFADMTALVGSAIGQKLAFQPISDEEERRQQTGRGVPEPLIEARLEIFRAIRAGRLASVTTNVASILGREPTSFVQWATQNAAAFR